MTTDDSCLDFDFDKVKEILKKDGLDNLIVDHTYEEKQEQIGEVHAECVVCNKAESEE